MDNEKNLPIIQETKALALSGHQVSLVSRGRDVLKGIAAAAQDDNNAAR